MGIGLIILAILFLLVGFFTPIGVGTSLLVSIVLFVLGIIQYRKQSTK